MEIVAIIRELVEEIKRHNGSYHHTTRKELIERAERVAAVLAEVYRQSGAPLAPKRERDE